MIAWNCDAVSESSNLFLKHRRKQDYFILLTNPHGSMLYCSIPLFALLLLPSTKEYFSFLAIDVDTRAAMFSIDNMVMFICCSLQSVFPSLPQSSRNVDKLADVTFSVS